MNKYVVMYSTGEYDDHREHIEPLYYEGTKGELKIEFKQSKKKIDSRCQMANLLSKLNMLDSYRRTWTWQSNLIKIGSRKFNISDFKEHGVFYIPTIYTLDEWFFDESGINDE